MESINIANLKIEKANAIKRYLRLRKIAALFRFIEVFFILIVVSRFSVRIPFTINLSGDYFWRIYTAALSPRNVFIIGNAIVIILVFISGRNSNTNSNPNSNPNEFSSNVYAEYVENRAKQRRENVFLLKREICRSKSADFRKVGGDAPRQQFRRSATDTCRQSSTSATGEEEEEEEMNGEEFRRKVEAFIARQQRSLREQEFSASQLVGQT